MAVTLGQGTVLQFGSPLAALSGVENIELNLGTRGKIKVTPIEAAANTYLLQIPKGGTLTFDLFWDSTDSGHLALLTASTTANQTDYFTIVANNVGDSTYAFTAKVSEFKQPIAKDSANMIKVTARLNSAVTFTA